MSQISINSTLREADLQKILYLEKKYGIILKQTIFSPSIQDIETFGKDPGEVGDYPVLTIVVHKAKLIFLFVHNNERCVRIPGVYSIQTIDKYIQDYLSSENYGQECLICLTQSDDGSIICNTCKQRVCQLCVDKIGGVIAKCPYCRAPLSPLYQIDK